MIQKMTTTTTTTPAPTWHHYPEIENEKALSECDLTSETFVVTEKIDGANFCLQVAKGAADDDVVFYSRNCRLGPTDSFFGFRDRTKHAELWATLQEAADVVREHAGGCGLLYGELFGGYFPHSSHRGVLNRVQYAPHLLFRAFDFSPDGERFYSWDEFAATFPESMRVVALHAGDLASCRAFVDANLQRRSDYATHHDEATQQVVEGFVVRRVRFSMQKYKYRVPAFSGKAIKPAARKTAPALVFPPYLTSEIFLSALSKTPHEEKLRKTDIPWLMKAIAADVVKDFGEKLDQKVLGAFVRGEIERHNHDGEAEAGEGETVVPTN